MSAPTQRPKVTAHEARQTAEAARERDWHKPSFAKELFLGRFRLDLVHPHPLPADEDVRRGEAFLAALREFCETRIDGARIEREARVPDETITGLKELGALGMKIDRKYGGLGLTQLYYNRALALVGSASPAVGALLSAHQSIGVPQPLKLFGTQEQKDAFLPRLARTDISAFLLTEPDVGSDPARLATSAVPDGDSYVLDGVKLWTTNGVIADLLVVMARVPASDGHPGGITAFVVEADSPGITVEHRNAFMGLRGLENGVTRFHGVRVPAANRIGPEGAGLKIALTTLNTGRLSLPAACAGAGKWCLRIAREWAGVREQWGGPVGRHEAVGTKISSPPIRRSRWVSSEVPSKSFCTQVAVSPLVSSGSRSKWLLRIRTTTRTRGVRPTAEQHLDKAAPGEHAATCERAQVQVSWPLAVRRGRGWWRGGRSRCRIR